MNNKNIVFYIKKVQTKNKTKTPLKNKQKTTTKTTGINI